MNNLETLLTIFLKPAQRLENTSIDMLTKRFVDTAEGAQLDVLGRLVGQPRGGLVDDTYRRYIRARVAANNSSGKREELINIARLVVNDASVITLHEEANATARLKVSLPQTSTTETVLVYFLTLAVGNGIRIIVETNAYPSNLRFKFAGSTTPGPGWDNTIALGTGGEFSDSRG